MFIFLIAAGIFSIFCAVKDYDWFIYNRRASLILRLFGRNGTRIFYILLGIFLIVLGIMAQLSGQL